MRPVVLFPEPDSPTSPYVSRSATWRERSSTASMPRRLRAGNKNLDPPEGTNSLRIR